MCYFTYTVGKKPRLMCEYTYSPGPQPTTHKSQNLIVRTASPVQYCSKSQDLIFLYNTCNNDRASGRTFLITHKTKTLLDYLINKSRKKKEGGLSGTVAIHDSEDESERENKLLPYAFGACFPVGSRQTPLSA